MTKYESNEMKARFSQPFGPESPARRQHDGLLALNIQTMIPSSIIKLLQPEKKKATSLM